jgi:oligoendopeptidase F
MQTRFVPADVDATSLAAVEPLFRALLDRPVKDARAFGVWVEDRGELYAALGEARANLYIATTCDTGDAGAAAAYARFVEEVEPAIKPLGFELDKRLVRLAAEVDAPRERYGVLVRSAGVGAELFRQENVALETRLSLLGQEFEKTAGAMSVVFEGQEKTLPQMARYQEETDRGLRERAWRAVAERRLREREAFDRIYDEMIALRQRVARNAGFEDFVGYAFRSRLRFDYGAAECLAFHDAVAEHIVPLVRAMDARRGRALGVEALRPWDLAVDEFGRGALRPFKGGLELMEKTAAAMRSLDPRLERMLRELGDGSEARGSRDGACLDLDSRKGKAPGGYQYMRDRSRKPFIFMNAAGLHSDVETMVHEAGHAFHSQLSRDEPIQEYRSTTEEFAEVASMSMELLSMPHWGAAGSFYEGKPTEFARARRQQLKRSVTLLPWIATIDAFQHWVYGNPGHTRGERTTAWLGLMQRFGNAVSWEGLEAFREALWQRQLHLFTHPFYYIEYGIAQLGALQLWVIGLERGEKAAVDLYIKGLSLGGSKPLPELFGAAGLEFDFSARTMRRLAERVEREMEKLPA